MHSLQSTHVTLIWFVRTTFTLVLTASFLQGIYAGENYLSLHQTTDEFPPLSAIFFAHASYIPTARRGQCSPERTMYNSSCITPTSLNSGISSALMVVNNLSMYVYTLRDFNQKTQFFLSSSDPSLLKAINTVKASLTTASTAGKQITTACTKAKLQSLLPRPTQQWKPVHICVYAH